MIRILYTDDSLPVGGKEILLLEYLKRIERDKFQVHLITLSSTGALTDDAIKLADAYTCMKRKHKFDPWVILGLRRYMRDNKIQIVHTSQWIDSLYVYIASLGLRAKRISTIHGYISGWRRRVHKLVLGQFEQAICVSQSSRDELIRQGYQAKRFSVIHNGIDLSKFRKKSFYNDAEKKLIIGMTGSFRKERDHLTLLGAVHRLIKAGYKNVELLFFGGVLDPVCKDDVLNYILENEIGSYVKFSGVQRNILELLSQLDIYVASSHSETFGLALVEAMASGLPVIVSEIPPFMEIIENGKYGLYFEKGNYKKLAMEIEFLMNNKSEMIHYGALAFERSTEFSIESNIDQLENVYRKILD